MFVSAEHSQAQIPRGARDLPRHVEDAIGFASAREPQTNNSLAAQLL
jgi:hypothetical protein